jgi:ABC-type branched-subunit amino acid transport system ATPase component
VAPSPAAGFDLADLFPAADLGERLILALRSVSVGFGGVRALDEVSFDVNAGEIVAVVGPNGAGKTTLLNCICGLARTQAGTGVTFCGTDVAGRSPAALAAAGMGRSFQDPQLIEDLSVLENVMAGGYLGFRYSMLDQCLRRRRVAALEAMARGNAMGLLELVGLDSQASRVVSQLPYGARKLVDIVRAMMSRPRLLLLDEPTSGLDTTEQALVTELLLQLRRTPGATVVLVEHHMDIVRAAATHALGLQAGAVLAAGPPAAVLDSPAFRAAIIGAAPAEASPPPMASKQRTGEA